MVKELQNAQVSDTTEADSSIIAKYKIYFLKSKSVAVKIPFSLFLKATFHSPL